MLSLDPKLDTMPIMGTMNQFTCVINQLREMILQGGLQPAERVTEAELAARLGVSRTPIRQALPVLAQEGLLMAAGKRGYAVRIFTREQTRQALHLRALLEGVAARTLAEHGATPELLTELNHCLLEGNALFTARKLADGAELLYAQMNQRFHQLIIDAAQNPLLSALIERCNVVPFTAPLNIVFATVSKDRAFDLLFCAHNQHHNIVQAIEQRQPDRAEALFREHAHAQEQSQALQQEST